MLLVTVSFQVLSLFTALRVATGVAASNPSQIPNSTQPVIVVPSKPTQNVVIPNSTPQFVSPVGSTIDASLVLAILFVAANIVVIGLLAYLYRRKKMKWFSLIVSLFLSSLVTELYFSFVSGLYSWIPIAAAVVALGVTLFAALRGSALVTNAIALVLALELGSSFPVLLQAPLNWIIPAVYAVFDVYAVYYGRMGKLVKEVTDAEQFDRKADSSAVVEGGRAKSRRLARWPDFGLLSIHLSEVEIGMADIAFYTMLPTVALLLNSLIAFVAVMATVDVGIFLSFILFRKREVSPGLPVPILLGLGALLVVSLVIH